MTVTQVQSSPIVPVRRLRNEPALPISDLLAPLAGGDNATLSITELGLLVQAVGDRPEMWRPVVRRPETDRWWIRLHGDDRVDVWLLSWLPGQSTDLHDHGGSSAAFTVVRGLLEETRVSIFGVRCAINRPTGSTTRIPGGLIHDVRARQGDPAVSIHAYSPPLREMTYYSPGPGGRLRPDRTIPSGHPEQERSG